MAAFLCTFVAATNSSRIFVFVFFEPFKYLPLIASAYSNMLRRVTSPPLGNTIYDATIPFWVTLIMSQFELLTTPVY